MKISIKITGIEISIDTGEAPQAPAIVEATAQALEAAVQPLLVSTVQPKRTGRTAKATPATPEPLAGPPEPASGEDVLQAAGFVPAATNGHDAGTTNASNPYRIDFHEFDSLIRAEMERLAPEPGVMPSTTIWNERRNPSFPSWNTVLTRYGCTTARSLAEKLGLKAQKPGPKPELAV